MASSRFPLDDFRFKADAFVPIRQDSQSFEERQKRIWDDMHQRMERRRKEWDDEVTRLRSDFFRLRPDDGLPALRGSTGDSLLSGTSLGGSSGSGALTNSGTEHRMFYDNPDSSKMFRVSFDVSQFEPEEISVRTQDQHLVVHARHEEKGGDKSVCREFSRQIDVPPNVDPVSLRSTLSKDGILQVEAPVVAPSYNSIRASGEPRSIMSSLDGAQSARTGGSFFSTTSTDPAVTTTSSSSALRTSSTTGTTSSSSSKTFRISVDIGTEFEPGDLSVKTVDRKLVVHARHEEKTPGRTSCREFNREFDLPDNIDPSTVTASLGEDGCLVIEAPPPRP